MVTQGRTGGQKGILGAERASLRLQIKPVLTQQVGAVGPLLALCFVSSHLQGPVFINY